MENVTAGIADALTVGKDGRPVVVVDWKSDVNPEAQLLGALSGSGPRLSRYDRRRARTRRSDDEGNGDCRLALAADGGGLTEGDTMASRKPPTGSNQDDLFNPEVELPLPARLAIDGKVLGSLVRQLAVPARRVLPTSDPSPSAASMATRRPESGETLKSSVRRRRPWKPILFSLRPEQRSRNGSPKCWNSVNGGECAADQESTH